MNEAVYGMTADEINYLWRNLSLYGRAKKSRQTVMPENLHRKNITHSVMSEAVFLCGRREADRFSGKSFCYDNGEAIKICEVDTGSASYISDCGRTVAYLHDRFGRDVESAIELLGRISCRRSICFLGNEMCIKADKDDILDGISEMLSAIYKAEKFGGIELCLDQKRESLKN